MTDYKSLWLKRSSAPHIRAREAVSGMLLDVIIALLPALLFAVLLVLLQQTINLCLL